MALAKADTMCKDDRALKFPRTEDGEAFVLVGDLLRCVVGVPNVAL